MSETPRASLIVPHYLGTILLRLLESLSLHTQEVDHEIIVVADQPYDDGSIAQALRTFPRIQVLFTKGGYGYGASCNLGLGVARGEYLVFLNNDVEVTPGWLSHLITEMENHPHTGICAPKVLSMRDPQRFDSSGAGGMIDIFGYPFVLGRVFDTIERDQNQYNEARDVFWGFGGALVVRRAVLERIGPFDPRFYMQMEEIDLCWRTHRAGYRVRVVPSAVVYHHGGWSLPEGSFLKGYLNHRNSLLLFFKNWSWPWLCRLLPGRLALEAFAFLYTLFFPARWKQALSILGAWGWLLSHPLEVLLSRNQRKGLSVCSDEEIASRMFPKSVALAYFLGNRRTAQQLLKGCEAIREKCFSDDCVTVLKKNVLGATHSA